LRAFSLGGGKFAFLFTDITERKRMEETLCRSEEKYRDLVKHAPAGIYEVDFRSKRFITVNDAMCQLSGYTSEEMLDMNPFDILDDQGKITFQARISQWLNGEKPDENVEYKVKTKDGREIYAVLNNTFISDKNGKPIGATVIAHDVTERKWAEEALQAKQEELASANEELQAQQEELTSMNEELQVQTEELNTAYQGLQCQADEIREYMEGVAQAHDEAVNEKNRLQAVMDALPVGVAIFDVHGGNVRTNSTFEKIWGGERPPVGAISDYSAYKAWWVESGQLVHPEEWASARAILKGETVAGQFINIERFDGTYAFVLNSAAPVFDAHGQIIGSAVAIHDITEQKELETALRESKKLAAIVANSEDAIFSMTLEGKMSSWNRGAMKLYGYTAEEVIDGSAFLLIPADFRERISDIMLSKANQGQGFEDNRAVRIRKDGTPIHVSIKSWRIMSGLDFAE
jgi:PAS domain S-box-containing protein